LKVNSLASGWAKEPGCAAATTFYGERGKRRQAARWMDHTPRSTENTNATRVGRAEMAKHGRIDEIRVSAAVCRAEAEQMPPGQ
jgi:hypothetical protein